MVVWPIGRPFIWSAERPLVEPAILSTIGDRRHRHRFGDSLGIELHFNRRRVRLHVSLARHRLHAGERERDRALPGWAWAAGSPSARS
jgi:hypothetical protein